MLSLAMHCVLTLCMLTPCMLRQDPLEIVGTVKDKQIRSFIGGLRFSRTRAISSALLQCATPSTPIMLSLHALLLQSHEAVRVSTALFMPSSRI